MWGGGNGKDSRLSADGSTRWLQFQDYIYSVSHIF